MFTLDQQYQDPLNELQSMYDDYIQNVCNWVASDMKKNGEVFTLILNQVIKEKCTYEINESYIYFYGPSSREHLICIVGDAAARYSTPEELFEKWESSDQYKPTLFTTPNFAYSHKGTLFNMEFIKGFLRDIKLDKLVK